MTVQESTTIPEKTPEPQAQTTQTPVVAKEESKESQEQINWRKFREQREIERKQKEASDKRAREKEDEANALKAAMEAILNKQNVHIPTANAGYQEEETEDQRIQRKIDEALSRERQRYQEERIQEEQRMFPIKLAQVCPDFDNICTPSNLDYLEYHYPEVVAGYRNQPDSVEKWSNLYKAVKRFVPQGDTKKEQAKLQNNQMKPQSFSAPTTLQGSTTPPPIYLDEARRLANWERMQREIKGVS